MASTATIPPHVALPKPVMDRAFGIRREGLDLTTANKIADVFRVFNGAVSVLGMFMEITTAASNNVCNMSWVFNSDAGGDRTIGAAVSITSAALGDFVWAELDGTALVKATTSTGLIHNGHYRGDANGSGTILTEGGIDIVLDSNALTTGIGTLYVVYEALVDGAVVAPEDMTLT